MHFYHPAVVHWPVSFGQFLGDIFFFALTVPVFYFFATFPYSWTESAYKHLLKKPQGYALSKKVHWFITALMFFFASVHF